MHENERPFRINKGKDPCWKENKLSMRCLDENGNLKLLIYYVFNWWLTTLSFKTTTRGNVRQSLRTTELAKASGTVFLGQDGKKWDFCVDVNFWIVRSPISGPLPLGADQWRGAISFQEAICQDWKNSHSAWRLVVADPSVINSFAAKKH